MNKISYSVYALALLIYGLFVFIMPHHGLRYDLECWIDWSIYMHQHGLGNIYDSGCNYLPGHLIQMKIYTLFFPTKDLIIQNIYYLKYFNFIFDVAGVLLVCSLVADTSKQKLFLLLMLLNPAYIHNTVAWGQFDSVFTCLIFASFLSLYRKRFMLSVILFVIALNFKFQAIIFVPALGLLLLYQWDFRFHWKNILIGSIAVILVQIVFILPFLMESSGGKLINNLKGLAGDFNYISLKASNIWFFLQTGDLRWTGDWNTFKGITFKTWGLIMLAGALLIVFIPFLQQIYLKLKKRTSEIPLTRLLLIFALVPLCFFYFNTQMHERYSYPAFIFIAAYALLTEKWWLYLLFSLAYFLNNDAALHSTTIFNYSAIAFDFQFISGLYLVIMIASVWLLYTPSKSSGNEMVNRA